jgi:hypothetical protein
LEYVNILKRKSKASNLVADALGWNLDKYLH